MRKLGDNEFAHMAVDAGFKTPCHRPIKRNGTPYGVSVEGYSRIPRTHDGRKVFVLAHRARFIAAHGSFGEGTVPDHLCRNRWCCNPEHVEAVTVAENNRRGSRTRLTPESVESAIRMRASGATCAAIAASLGVHPSVISRATRGENWASGPSPAWNRVKSRREQAGRAERGMCHL